MKSIHTLRIALPAVLLTSLLSSCAATSRYPGDRVEDRYDQIENRYDRQEDRYDRRHYSGPGDHIENRYDRTENRWDRREGRYDRRGAW